MFVPPRCPHQSCDRHREPGTEPFFVRRGFYYPKCRPRGVPRFRCKTCGRGFSRQTFRMDYGDHKPELNASVFSLISSGLGLRQTARMIPLTRRCTVLKFRKVARHLGHLNANLRGSLEGEHVELQFDEFETYEGRRNTRPLTIPMLIERSSRFIVGAVSAPIRPRGKMTASRKRAIAADEARFGPRKDRSRKAIKMVLEAGAALCKAVETVVLQTDEKSSYPGLAAEAFGERLVHETTNSQLARATWNPLFPINHTEAMARDLVSRLRRESWLVSKRGWCLDLHLQLHMAHRNYVRRRVNEIDESPAQALGFVDRRMKPTELVTWRQDWGERSIHPLAA